MDVPAFGCVHAYVLLSVCAVKKVHESARAQCGKMCQFLFVTEMFNTDILSLLQGLFYVIHDHSDYCKLNLNVE